MTHIGIAIGVGKAGGEPSLLLPTANQQSYFRLEDGNFTTATGIDLINGDGALDGTYRQPIGSLQPTQSTLGTQSRIAASFDNVDDSMNHSTLASSWTFLHNGTGMTVYIVVDEFTQDASGMLFATCRGNAGDIGVALARTGTNLTIRVCNGSGTFLYSDIPTSIAAAPAIYTFRYEESVTPEVDVRRNGTSISSGAGTGSPSASAPQGTMFIGNAPAGGGVIFDGAIAELACYNVRHSDAIVSSIETTLNTFYGIF